MVKLLIILQTKGFLTFTIRIKTKGHNSIKSIFRGFKIPWLIGLARTQNKIMKAWPKLGFFILVKIVSRCHQFNKDNISEICYQDNEPICFSCCRSFPKNTARIRVEQCCFKPQSRSYLTYIMVASPGMVEVTRVPNW